MNVDPYKINENSGSNNMQILKSSIETNKIRTDEGESDRSSQNKKIIVGAIVIAGDERAQKIQEDTNQQSFVSASQFVNTMNAKSVEGNSVENLDQVKQVSKKHQSFQEQLQQFG